MPNDRVLLVRVDPAKSAIHESLNGGTTFVPVCAGECETQIDDATYSVTRKWVEPMAMEKGSTEAAEIVFAEKFRIDRRTGETTRATGAYTRFADGSIDGPTEDKVTATGWCRPSEKPEAVL